CLGVTCSAPHQQGGGGSCGCGCGVWVAGTGQQNTISVTDDSDGDGVPDNLDNCPFVANPGQGDSDGDGVCDAWDHCPRHSNPDQANGHAGMAYVNASYNGHNGNACNFIDSGPYAGQKDSDGDRIPDSIDNCIRVPNTDQQKSDPSSNFGDVCNAHLC